MNQTAAYQLSHTGVSSASERNRGLRNICWLLALSMVPTVLGVWIGVTTGIARAITATLGVYLSLYNVLQSLLALLGIAGSREE